jgi:hypothetical protein
MDDGVWRIAPAHDAVSLTAPSENGDDDGRTSSAAAGRLGRVTDARGREVDHYLRVLNELR